MSAKNLAAFLWGAAITLLLFYWLTVLFKG